MSAPPLRMAFGTDTSALVIIEQAHVQGLPSSMHLELAPWRSPQLGGRGNGPYATALNPFFATRVNSFNDAPRGRFSPRSHWLTRPVVTLR